MSGPRPPNAPDRTLLLRLLPVLLVAVAGFGCGDDTVSYPDGWDFGADADADADGFHGIGSPYDEPLCSAASLADLEAAYVPAAWRDSVLPALDTRYAIGAYVLRDVPAGLGCDWAMFMPDSSSFAGMLDGFGVLVHELGHCWGFQFFGSGYAYLVTDTLEFHTSFLDTFDRSEISTVHEYLADDFYADTYLTGSSGAQGFSTVLDELNQYTHSLAIAWCYRDYRSPGMRVSARDGLLTFLYYTEKYLQLARTVHPGDYDRILGDEQAMRALDTLWGRANLYLELTAAETSLGINDDRIAGYVFAEANLDELRLVLP